MSEPNIEIEFVHQASCDHPDHQKEAGVDCGTHCLIRNPTSKHFAEEIRPKVYVSHHYIGPHENCHQGHQHKNNQRVQPQPFQRSGDYLDYPSTPREYRRKEVNHQIEEGETCSTDGDHDESETSRVDFFVEGHQKSHWVDQHPQDAGNEKPVGCQFFWKCFITTHYQGKLVSHKSSNKSSYR